MTRARGKFCIHCGVPLLTRRGSRATELYDQELFKKSKIIKLLECPRCDLAADNYIEGEGVAVLIDLALQNPEAYRHVLFNGNGRYAVLIYKMTLLTIICDGYIRWAGLSSSGEFFEQEYQFYIMCLNVALGLAAFLSVALLSLFHRTPSLWTLFVGLLMAYSARFFHVAALLWASPMDPGQANHFGSSLMWGFIYLLFFAATLRVIQVATNISPVASGVIAFLSHVAWNLTLHFELILHPHVCLEESGNMGS